MESWGYVVNRVEVTLKDRVPHSCGRGGEILIACCPACTIESQHELIEGLEDKVAAQGALIIQLQEALADG